MKQITKTFKIGGLICILFIIGIFLFHRFFFKNEADEELNMLVFSDLHYLSPNLYEEESPDFQHYQTDSRRLITASASLWKNTVTAIAQYPEDIILICGDISNDGELRSHLEVVEDLHKLRQAGKKIFVIPGNNDILNEDATVYKKDTLYPTYNLSRDEFLHFYHSFGYDEAISTDTASLSYVAKLDQKNWLFAIDATIYSESGNVLEYRNLDRRTIDWLNVQFEKAHTQNINTYVMMHYGMVEHFNEESTMYTSSLLKNHQAMANYFADKGVKVAFTGHFHANDITFFESLNRNKLYDIETSSYIAPPFAFRRVNIKNNRMQLFTESLLNSEQMKEENGRWHAEYEDLLTESYKRLLTRSSFSLNQTLADLIAPTYAKAMIAHYKGDEVQNENIEATVRMLKVLNFPFNMNFIYTLYKDLPPTDNQLVIDLSEK